jgi:hypothetical protein
VTREEQEALRARVAELSAGAESPEDAYWLSGELDDNEEYCHDCAEKKLDEIRRKRRDPELGGLGCGCGTHESDSQLFCEMCGKKLMCSLTNYGIEQEIEHFEQYWFEALDHPAEWAALGKVLDALMYDDDEKWDRIAAILELREPGIRTSEAPPDFLDGAIA